MTSSEPSFPRIVIVGIVVGLIHFGFQYLSYLAKNHWSDSVLLGWVMPQLLPVVVVAFCVILMKQLVERSWPGCVTVAAVVFFFSLILVYGPFDEAIESVWAMALFLADALAMKLIYPLRNAAVQTEPDSDAAQTVNTSAEEAALRRGILRRGTLAGCLYLACWIATIFIAASSSKSFNAWLWYYRLLPILAAGGVSLVFAVSSWENWFLSFCLALMIWAVGIAFYPLYAVNDLYASQGIDLSYSSFFTAYHSTMLLMWAGNTLVLTTCLWLGYKAYCRWTSRAGRE